MSPTPPVIAVIDDDESVRRALGRLLRAVGWQGQVFSTAVEFLETTARALPDCLILDMHLPKMSGLELQERLAAAGRKVPIVFITAYPDAAARECGLRSGAVAFLHKPFDEQALIDAVERALGAPEAC
jgi:FixJ family two-component response regulator